MNRLYSIGELLIDFHSSNMGAIKDVTSFNKKAGGAPANVASQAVRLGVEASYISKVGDDGFGEFLISTLNEVGIDTTYVKKDKRYNTSLAFVSFKDNGEREFSFYRKNAADLYLDKNDYLDINFNQDDILEFGSVALASKEARDTHNYLINKARDKGAIIAFDPNIRLNLWEDKEELRKIINEYYPEVDIMKVGIEELEFITLLPLEEGIKKILDNNIKILLVTDGSKGAKLYVKDSLYYCKGYKVKAVDTTGAGDSFFGAFLSEIINNNIKKEKLTDLNNNYQQMLEFACKAGAYTTTLHGAIQIMGKKEEIERMVK